MNVRGLNRLLLVHLLVASVSWFGAILLAFVWFELIQCVRMCECTEDLDQLVNVMEGVGELSSSFVEIHEVHWDSKWMGSLDLAIEQHNKSNSWPGPQ